jgi:hypothetical protein
MRWLIRYLIYALAAYALYRLWSARGFVWWALLASAILMGWTAAMVKTAVKDRASVDLAVAVNPRLAAHRSVRGSTQVVRYRVAVNVVISAVTLALSIWAIVVSG